MSDSASALWRILCVDDEPDVLEILSITLGTKHEVIVAHDGVEAIGMLDLGEPDFIVCDVRMPNMDGFQTVEAIRCHPRFGDIPVFFLTAEVEREKAQKGFAVGGNLYLTKPFEPLRVLENIDYFLKEHGRQPRDKSLTLSEVEREAKRLGQPEPQAPVQVDPTEVRIVIIGALQPQVDRIYSALQDQYACVKCADPADSLQHLFRYDPDILIINPAIPKLSGFGLVQMIRHNEKLHTLPIVMVQDKNKPFDERLLPSLTPFPPLNAAATPGDVQDAVEQVIRSDGFFIRPKRASIEQMQAEEKKVHRNLSTSAAREARRQDSRRQRYERVQTFIDKNR